MGSEVNLDSRLESQAEPGGIVMAYEIYALVSDIVHAEEQAPIQVKGVRRPIRPFALVDLDKLAPEERAAVAVSHEAAADELK